MSKIWMNKKLYIVDEEVQAHITEQATEIDGLKKFIKNNNGILKSANNDVRRLSKYSDELQARITEQDTEIEGNKEDMAKYLNQAIDLQARIAELEGAVEKIAILSKHATATIKKPSGYFKDITGITEQALPAQPKCKTCGKSEEVSSDACFSGTDTLTEKVEPCPDCT